MSMNAEEENCDYGKIPWFLVRSDISGENMELTLPQAFPIPASIRRFYERDCYAIMYELIYARMQLNTARLQRVDPVMCAAVFGTPGIGTSIFEFYFFNRYISDHPNHVIMLSSWKDFHVNEIFLYNANQSRSLTEVDKIVRGVHLHLCDGAPNLTFLDPTVCFTSPNFKFFDSIIGRV
jgi:hypothetical protein